jgi:cytochrome c oxidase subunit 4
LADRTEQDIHITAYRTYVYVWVALMFLLALTIVVAKVEVIRYSVLVNLLIASVKAILVLSFFMHLKDEGPFLRSLLVIVLLTLTSIIMLMFSDVWYR